MIQNQPTVKPPFSPPSLETAPFSTLTPRRLAANGNAIIGAAGAEPQLKRSYTEFRNEAAEIAQEIMDGEMPSSSGPLKFQVVNLPERPEGSWVEIDAWHNSRVKQYLTMIGKENTYPIEAIDGQITEVVALKAAEISIIQKKVPNISKLIIFAANVGIEASLPDKKERMFEAISKFIDSLSIDVFFGSFFESRAIVLLEMIGIPKDKATLQAKGLLLEAVDAITEFIEPKDLAIAS
jgi:hypothetical protein